MSDQEKVKTTSPPYVTYKTFSNFINGLRDHGLPLQIDRSLMSSYSGSVQTTLLAALKSLKLLDFNSSPTDEFEKLHSAPAGSEQYQEALRAVVYKTYPFLSDGSIDIERATGKQLEDKFRQLGVGGGTIAKTYSFFVAITKDSGLPVSVHITNKKPSAPKKNTSNGGSRATKKAKDVSPVHTPAPTPPPSGTFSFEIPVFGKATARVSLPKDMTESEWLLIKTIIDAQAAHLLSVEEVEED